MQPKWSTKTEATCVNPVNYMGVNMHIMIKVETLEATSTESL